MSVEDFMLVAMKILFLLSLLSLISCSTNVRSLGTRMLSPESQGELGKGAIDARIQGNMNSKLNFANDKTQNHVERGVPSYALGLAGDMGLVRKLDVYAIAPLNDAAGVLGLKYQLIGESRKEAKKGNFSVSIAGGFGSSSTEATSSDLTVNGDNVKKLKTDRDLIEGGLIAGYRWADNIVNYVNAYYVNQHVEGKVSTDSGVLVNAPFHYNQNSYIYSTGLIFYNNRLQLKVDYSHMVSNWIKTGSHTASTLNGGIGLSW
jgi:hypothetical protein